MTAVEQVTVKVLPGGLVDRQNAAAFVGRKRQTLAAWAVSGIGPKHININGRAYYPLDELQRFMSAAEAAA